MLGFVDDRALDFDDATRYRDACFLGDCDDGVKQLAEHLDAAFAAVDGGGGGAATASGDGEGTSTGGAAAADGEVPLPAERGWAASLRHRIETHPPVPPRAPMASAGGGAAGPTQETEAVAASDAPPQQHEQPTPSSDATLSSVPAAAELPNAELKSEEDDEAASPERKQPRLD